MSSCVITGRSIAGQLRFGIFDHIDDAGVPLAQLYEGRLRLAELYDQAGFYAYHCAEHHGTPLGLAPSPALWIASLAQRTERLRLHAMVFVLPLYDPLRLIEEICMLDNLSEGRLGVGIGRGVSPLETGFFGVDEDEGRARYEEALEVIRAGLTSETLSYSGRFYRYEDVPMTLRPLQRPHPPLWLGIGYPEKAAWAAAHDVNVVGLLPADPMRAITDRYRVEWETLGRPADQIPLMGLNRHIVLADSEAEALRIGRRAFAPWRRALDHLWKLYGVRSPLEGKMPHDFDEFRAAGLAYAGTPEGAREYVAEQCERAGANYLCADVAFGDIAFEEAARTVELLAQHVMPAFSGP
jgi:alkanesulfonate monooxygenase SsuD/methylene tetrahydromethanopterin reductase-like flavin-dependent oxidoreductase (luciferase family)